MADLIESATTNSAAHTTAEENVGLREAQLFGTTPEVLQDLTEQATAFASAHGMIVASGRSSFTHAPYSLFPMKYPRLEFEKGIELSTLFSLVVDKISRDTKWLYKNLEKVIQEDEFTRRLVEISKSVETEGLVQKAALGIFRSDYMLHEPVGQKPRLQQVELNTIASSFSSLTSITSDMHRFLLGRFSDRINLPFVTPRDSKSHMEAMPKNPSMMGIPNSIAGAHEHYGVSSAVVVFVVQPGEVNAFDQKWIEHNLWDHHQIPVKRMTLKEICTKAKLCGESRRLVVDDQEVSVVYFRAGYAPTDYPTEAEWEARLLVERSFAIKCPNITYHLAGTKKVQQVLSAKGELERFLPESSCELVRESFADLYGLDADSDHTARVIEKVKESPEDFVMKPQREGGGNNIYGRDILTALAKLSAKELESYIIMSRIVPKTMPGALVRSGKLIISESCLSELGLYCCSLFDNGVEVFNGHSGHLLRSKFATTNEGGIASGFAVLSSPYLV